jgi:hypothetical protein
VPPSAKIVLSVFSASWHEGALQLWRSIEGLIAHPSVLLGVAERFEVPSEILVAIPIIIVSLLGALDCERRLSKGRIARRRRTRTPVPRPPLARGVGPMPCPSLRDAYQPIGELRFRR